MTYLFIILLALSWISCDNRDSTVMAPVIFEGETVEYSGIESDTLRIVIDGYVRDCPPAIFPQNTQIALSFISRDNPFCNITIVTWTNSTGYYHLPALFLCTSRYDYTFYVMGNDGVYQVGALGVFCWKKLRIDFGID